LANGEEPFLSKAAVVDMPTGLRALDNMKELWSLCDKIIYQSNPISIAELMTKTDDYWYCPFAYCYSNYSRLGYAKNMLTYKDLPQFKDYGRLRSTIGGTGIAISSTCKHLETAIQFIQWITSGECQSTFYVENGGQPGHLSAWLNANANLITHNFFSNLLPAMQRGYMRPRYNGYLHFQDHAGEPIRDYLMGKRDAASTLGTMDRLYRESLKRHPINPEV